MSDTPIENVMKTHIRTVTADQSLSEIREVFESENFRHLPVMNGESLVGIITHTDLMRVTYGAHITDADFEVNRLILESTTVEEAMSKDLKTVELGAGLAEAARIMRSYKVNCVPVMGQNGLAGIVTGTDIMEAYIKLVG